MNTEMCCSNRIYPVDLYLLETIGLLTRFHQFVAMQELGWEGMRQVEYHGSDAMSKYRPGFLHQAHLTEAHELLFLLQEYVDNL
jgi:hypothetical protein